MTTDLIDLGHGKIEILKDRNLIYSTVYGVYTDDDSITLRKYVNDWLEEISGPTIRIWNTTNILDGNFRLTSTGVDRTARWVEGVHKKWPGSIHYSINNKNLTYGMARMYQLKSLDQDGSIVVLKSIDELPDDIKTRIHLGLNI